MTRPLPGKHGGLNAVLGDDTTPQLNARCWLAMYDLQHPVIGYSALDNVHIGALSQPEDLSSSKVILTQIVNVAVLHQQAIGVIRLYGVGGTVVNLAVMHSHIFTAIHPDTGSATAVEAQIIQ